MNHSWKAATAWGISWKPPSSPSAFTAGEHLHYPRWKSGSHTHGLDFISLTAGLVPEEAVKIKYSDRPAQRPATRVPWQGFSWENNIPRLTITTRTHEERIARNGIAATLEPAAIHSYRLGLGK
ncbi:hypothetical protein HNR46_001222 [Haloferula luteola]|uniref:Uncharacterized protein n=1 Tax=Haloferula luteola TaxID=595692 RepID=A0A840V8C5_9BACT|nr:hypothetical protein [Haloferula luteola]MBB5350988.1 hypothetical protein [Haloferula luteola]